MFRRQKKNDAPFRQNIFPALPKHREVMTVQKPFDVYLFFTTLSLVLIGIMMIFSSSAILAKENYDDTYYYLKKELIFFVIGFVALFITKAISYKRYAKWIYALLFVTLILMGLTFLPGISHSAKGATRWVRLAGFGLQPSEIAKITLIIFTAYLIAKKDDKIRKFSSGILPILLVSGAFVMMILWQRDLGSAFVIGAVIFILLFISEAKLKHLLFIVLSAAPVIYFLIFNVDFRKKRFLAFLDPWKDQLGTGYQVVQSYVAFKSGGLSGVGLGESKQKLFYLPEAHTDFIFSVLGEEFGMIGVLIVVSLFLFFVYRGFRIAVKTLDPFGRYLALGLTCLLGLQAFINFGVVMGLLPTKGLTLPFISYGGTSLIVSLASVGILLNISTHTGEEM